MVKFRQVREGPPGGSGHTVLIRGKWGHSAPMASSHHLQPHAPRTGPSPRRGLRGHWWGPHEPAWGREDGGLPGDSLPRSRGPRKATPIRQAGSWGPRRCPHSEARGPVLMKGVLSARPHRVTPHWQPLRARGPGPGGTTREPGSRRAVGCWGCQGCGGGEAAATGKAPISAQCDLSGESKHPRRVGSSARGALPPAPLPPAPLCSRQQG